MTNAVCCPATIHVSHRESAASTCAGRHTRSVPLTAPCTVRERSSAELVHELVQEKQVPYLSSLFNTSPPSMRRYFPAFVAGSIGGLVAGFLKLGWEVPWPPRAPGRIPEPQVLVSLFTHHPTPAVVSLVIHFTFSILMGTAYALLAEIFPIITLGMGVAFGLAIQIGAHELIMPMIGLTPATWLLPASEQGSEFLGHILWGFTIGVFYEALRRRLTAPRTHPSEAKS